MNDVKSCSVNGDCEEKRSVVGESRIRTFRRVEGELLEEVRSGERVARMALKDDDSKVVVVVVEVVVVVVEVDFCVGSLIVDDCGGIVLVDAADPGPPRKELTDVPVDLPDLFTSTFSVSGVERVLLYNSVKPSTK